MKRANYTHFRVKIGNEITCSGKLSDIFHVCQPLLSPHSIIRQITTLTPNTALSTLNITTHYHLYYMYYHSQPNHHVTPPLSGIVGVVGGVSIHGGPWKVRSWSVMGNVVPGRTEVETCLTHTSHPPGSTRVYYSTRPY